MRIGIYGGSFNPIHASHIQVASHAAQYFDVVWLMPCYESTKHDIVSPKHRLAMCEIACKTLPKIMACDYEITHKLTGGTYTVLSHMKYMNHFLWNCLNPTFILGKDAADSIEEWQNWENLIRDFQFLVYNRNGAKPLPPGAWYTKPPHIYIPSGVTFEISSTEIRESLAEPSTQWLLPKEVSKYIKDNNLYTN
jgi:nicotinate-nucleotide adenylyltransferase